MTFWANFSHLKLSESANVAVIPKAELQDPQVKDLFHDELVIPPNR